MISLRSRMIPSFVAGGAALLLAASLAVLTTANAPAAIVTSSCSPTKVRYMASDLDASSTTSVQFVQVPEAVVSFTQGGTGASCVLVRFSAQVFVASGAGSTGIFRAFLDNTKAALPESVQFTGNSTSNEARSFEFIFPLVAPGNHVVRMQFRSNTGTNVFVERHNTIVQHVP